MKLPCIGLLYMPQVKLFHFAVPQIIFGDEFGEKLFDLKIIAAKPQHKTHLPVAIDGGLELASQMDVLIVAGWHDTAAAPSAGMRAALLAARQNGATLVGLCYGAYALAYCGLLDGKKATTHWAAAQDFKARFPAVRLDTNTLYAEDDRIVTSAGTAASLDCCLYLVRKLYDSRTANKIARFMVVPPHREGGQAQFIDTPVPMAGKGNRISQLLESIQKNPAATYHIDELASTLAMSRRSFTRHFQKATGMSFTQWLIDVRLKNSLELLEAGNLPVEKIAELTGFHDAVSFRKHFKDRYQVSPSAWRKVFAGNEG